MDSSLRNSIILITGNAANRFGTGFAIHQDGKYTYILTCAHVVRDVGGNDAVRIDENIATVIAYDMEDGFDLAILRVEKILDNEVLRLNISGGIGCSFITAGFHLVGKQTLSQDLKGVLGEQVGLLSKASKVRCDAWYLNMEGDYYLQPGYSGAPIFDEVTGTVLGIVNLRQGEGKKGLAISVGALKEFWPEMPFELLSVTRMYNSTSAFTEEEPLMNLHEERAAFEKIATGQDIQTRIILINGGHGMGKTYLLSLYKQIATANNFEFLNFNLGLQISIEACIEQIVGHFGVNHFPNYDECCSVGFPKTFTRHDEEVWQRNLTRKFFLDLSKYGGAQLLPIFFDQYEKADRAFKTWITNIFLPYISTRYPITVVIAGQEEIQDLPFVKIYRHFHLKGVTLDCYYRYAEDYNTNIDPKLIDEFHKILHGRPKDFADYIKLQAVSKGAQ